MKMRRLTLSLLGAFEAILDGKSLTVIKTDKARALLIYLAMERGRAHRRQTLAGLLWPDYMEEGARANLRRALSNLRQALGDEQNQGPFILVEGETLQFNPESHCWLDVSEFERLAAGSAISDLESAIHLYRGGFLEGFTLKDSSDFDNWTAILRDRYLGQASVALGKLAEAYEQRKEYEKAIGYTRRRLELEPWQEDAHRQLMRLLALSGQRSSALAQYETCRKILKEELGVEPAEETRRLQASIREGEISGAGQAKRRLNNLPAQLTSFIGREKEIAQVKSLLVTHRMVSLIGPGGTGKTRLSLQVAGGLLEQYPDGAWLVELAPLSDSELVVQTVARTLGMKLALNPQALSFLEDYLKPRYLLLILDNCEHLIETCARLADTLLHACPNLNILASSRESLGIDGEASFLVPPLVFPKADEPLENLAQYEAINLFAERAGAASPGFQITTENAPAIVRVCQRLDGIPLALELAAARVRLLQVEEIVQRLDDRFRLLTGGSRAALPRYQTLRASIDWSYDLLTLEERSLLQRLSVFAGSWSLEAAESVGCGDDIEAYAVLDLLGQLVNKSLVTTIAETSPGSRYRMLETIRQYAHEKLVEAGGAAQARDRHLGYYVELAEKMGGKIRGPDQVAILELLEIELDNLRLALAWSLEGKGKPGWSPEPGLRMTTALFWFWFLRGRQTEGWLWLEPLLASTPTESIDKPASPEWTIARAEALWVAGGLAEYSGNYSQAIEMLNESRAFFQELGPDGKLGYAHALMGLGSLYTFGGDRSKAISLLEESLAIFKAKGDRFFMGECIHTLGDGALLDREFTRAKEYFLEAQLLSREIGDEIGLAFMLSQLGMVSYYLDEPGKARMFWEESQVIASTIGDIVGLVNVLEEIGILEWTEGKFELASSYFDEVRAVSRQQGFVFGINHALSCFGKLALSQDDVKGAGEKFDESLAFNRKQNYRLFIAYSLCDLGDLAWAERELDQALKKYTEAREIFHELDHRDEALALFGLGKIALAQGDLGDARRFFIPGLVIFPTGSSFWSPEQNLEAVALLAISEQQLERSALLLGASEAWLYRTQRLRTPRERQERESAIVTVRGALGEDAFTATWEEGRAMSLEQAVAYALEEYD